MEDTDNIMQKGTSSGLLITRETYCRTILPILIAYLFGSSSSVLPMVIFHRISLACKLSLYIAIYVYSHQNTSSGPSRTPPLGLTSGSHKFMWNQLLPRQTRQRWFPNTINLARTKLTFAPIKSLWNQEKLNRPSSFHPPRKTANAPTKLWLSHMCMPAYPFLLI